MSSPSRYLAAPVGQQLAAVPAAVAGMFTAIDGRTFRDASEAIQHYKTLPPARRAEIHQDYVQLAARMGTVNDDFMYMLYQLYIQDPEVRSLVSEDTSDYRELKEGAERARKRRNKKEECYSRIQEDWGQRVLANLQHRFDSLGDTAWEHIRALARVIGNFSTAQPLVVAAAFRRLQNPRPGRSRSYEIQPSDWKAAKDSAATLVRPSNDDLMGVGLQLDPDGWLMPWTHQPRLEMGESAQSQVGPTIASPSEESLPPTADEAATSLDEVTASGIDSAVLVSEASDRESDDSAAPPRRERNTADNDDTGETTPQKYGCGCDKTISKSYLSQLQLKRVTPLAQTLNLVKSWFAAKEKEFCWQHLQALCAIVGYQTKHLNRSSAKQRLIMFHDAIRNGTIGKLKTNKDTYQFFRRTSRPPRASDRLGPYKLPPQELPEVELTTETQAALCKTLQIDQRRWEETGSVVADCFLWWGEIKYTGTEQVPTPTILEVVSLEFDMYRYHLREINGRENMGWLRNMFHSLGQQVMRQDPLYYLIYCALRPDCNHKLVTYPYYAKYQSAGEKTAFRHIDVNISRLAKDGRGASQIQGTMSLDDEYDDDCTEILPGMHRRFREWEERLSQRGLASEALVQRITAYHFTDSDKSHFGTDWTPQPCKSMQVRVTVPHLPHGALGPAQRTRRTMLPWFVALQEDHETLEVAEAGTWSDLSRAHRDLTAAAKSPSGFPNQYGVIPYAFAGSVALKGLGELSDALVCRGRHDSFPVRREKATLFHGTDDDRHRFLYKWRINAVNKVCEAFGLVMAAEMAAFGGKSYFSRLQASGGRQPPPISDFDEQDEQEEQGEGVVVVHGAEENGRPQSQAGLAIEAEVEMKDADEAVPTVSAPWHLSEPALARARAPPKCGTLPAAKAGKWEESADRSSLSLRRRERRSRAQKRRKVLVEAVCRSGEGSDAAGHRKRMLNKAAPICLSRQRRRGRMLPGKVGAESKPSTA